MVVGPSKSIENKYWNQYGLVAPESTYPCSGRYQPGSAAQGIKRNKHDAHMLYIKLNEVERVRPNWTGWGNQRVRSARNAPERERQQNLGAARGEVNYGKDKTNGAKMPGQTDRSAPYSVNNLVRMHSEVECGKSIAKNPFNFYAALFGSIRQSGERNSVEGKKAIPAHQVRLKIPIGWKGSEFILWKQKYRQGL